MVVDDAHLADLPSLTALNFTMRRLRTDPVMLVLGTRPEGAARLPAGLVHPSETTVTNLSIGGLSTDEVQALTAARRDGPLSHRAAERLRIHTGGSPLHLCALLDEIPAATLE